MNCVEKLDDNKINDKVKKSLQKVSSIEDGKVKTLDNLEYELEHPSFWNKITAPFCRFFYLIKKIYWSIKYAIQRVKQGYDSRDVFSFCDTFSERMVKILTEFKKYNVGMWNLYDNDGKFIRQLSEYEQNLVLNEMIQCFRYSNEMVLMKVRYPFIYENDEFYNKHQNEYFKKMDECEQDSYKYNKSGLQLLTKYFQQIWF